MSKKLLITRPEHDDTTYYLSNWSRKALEAAQRRGIKILDLYKTRATKSSVTSMIDKQGPGLVIFNGHGSERMVSGHKNEPLIIAGENEHLLQSTITYSISCKSAKLLGPKSVDAGAKAYIGYDDDFIFLYDPNKITRPLRDDTAALFLEPPCQLISSLIKGNTVGEARKRSEQSSKDNIRKMLSSDVTPEETSMVRFLWWDMVHQVCVGDKKSRL